MKYLKPFNENDFYDDSDYKYHKQVVLDVFQDVIDDYNMETSIDEDFKMPPGFCFRIKPLPRNRIYAAIYNRDDHEIIMPMPDDVNNNIKKSINRLERMGYVIIIKSPGSKRIGGIVNRYNTRITIEYEAS